MNYSRTRRTVLRQISTLAVPSAVASGSHAKTHSTTSPHFMSHSFVQPDEGTGIRENAGEAAWARITIGEKVVRGEQTEPFLGFNINFLNFQEAFYGPDGVQSDVIGYLRELPGCTYRYPGGLVANTFDWEGAVGAVETRRKQITLERMPPAAVRFGPAEYLQFLKSVHGKTFHVLNLVGWSANRLFKEMETTTIAASNSRLAAWRVMHEEPLHFRYYQLGNELDRSEYEWPHSKYIERCRASIDAILAVDPQARFVAFLREFNWRYRGRPGVSRAEDFVRDVIHGLPEVHDYSLNVYYDSPRKDRNTDIPHRLRMIQQTVDVVRSLTNGRAGLWITEHAKQLPENQRAGSILDTSGIEGAISAVDFVLSMVSLQEIRGIFWHAVGTGKWSLFLKDNLGVSPTPVYWAMRLLYGVSQWEVLESRAQSSNRSGYAGGYDCRALAFRDGYKIRILLVNRHATTLQAHVTLREWAQRIVIVSMSYVRDDAKDDYAKARMKVDINNGTPEVQIRLGPAGDLYGNIPGRSVCVINVTLRG